EVAVREEGAELVATIRDYGPGIPSEQLDRIFERFYRVKGRRAPAAKSNSDAAAPAGFGLGLAIAQRVAQAHDASLNVSSRVSEDGSAGSGTSGTTFTFRIKKV